MTTVNYKKKTWAKLATNRHDQAPNEYKHTHAIAWAFNVLCLFVIKFGRFIC